ncbi:MAG: hypothetical protein OHK0035_38480 [Cyanobacteria bacterium J069]
MNRWWIYQKERFPLFTNGLLIAAFAAGAVGYGALVRGAIAFPVGAWAIAFPCLFLFFLQLRIADEFKDAETDRQHRPYRPVPRGLVTLKELSVGAIAAAVLQLGLSLAVGRSLVGMLGLVWGYLGLMTREFFAPRWLKARPLAYLLSHAVILPLMAGFAMACDWAIAGATPDVRLLWFGGVSYFISLAIEIGRKIRAPQDEEPGVETYTALWGLQKAAIAWLTVIWLLAIAALLSADAVGILPLVVLVVLPLLTLSMVATWRFLARPIPHWAEAFQGITGFWVLGICLTLGLVPFWI